MSDICEAPSAVRNEKDLHVDPKSKPKSKSNLIFYLLGMT